MWLWNKENNQLLIIQDEDYLTSDYLEKMRYLYPAAMFDINKWNKWIRKLNRGDSEDA